MTKRDDRSRENDRNHRSNSTQPSEVRAEDVAPPGAVPDTPSVHRESAKDMVVNSPPATEEDIERFLGGGWSFGLFIPQRPTPEAVDASDSGLSSESPSPDDASTES